MIEDLTTSIKAQLYERVSSPLLSSFSLSWCAWNYKFLLIIFSGMSSHEKIVYIDMNLFQNFMAMLTHGVFLPLVTSMLLIFVYPIPAEFIYKHVKLQQRRLKEIQQSIDDESPLSKEQARKIRKESLEIQLKYDNEIDAKTSENTRLKEMIAELQQKIDKTTDNPHANEPKEDSVAAPSENAELPDEEKLPDLVAIYKAAKGESTTDNVNIPTEELDEDDKQNILDIHMRDKLLDYIGKLSSFSGVEFDVVASKGMLKVLLGTIDGDYLPYITADYNFNSALQVLESVKNALVNDSPPKTLKGRSVGERHLPSHNSSVVRDFIAKGLQERKSIPEIRRDLLGMGIPQSVFNTVIAAMKRTDEKF